MRAPLLLAAALTLTHILHTLSIPLPSSFTAPSPSDPAHEIYGWIPMYPNTTLNGIVVEGPFPYHNGPMVWNDTQTAGAYGALACHCGTLAVSAGQTLELWQ